MKCEPLFMITIPAKKQIFRESLETDLEKFLKTGGKIKEVPSEEKRKSKEKLIKTHLFFSVHHPFHSKNTGISTARLKAIQRTVSCASDEEIETLWVYFRSREISNDWKDAL